MNKKKQLIKLTALLLLLSSLLTSCSLFGGISAIESTPYVLPTNFDYHAPADAELNIYLEGFYYVFGYNHTIDVYFKSSANEEVFITRLLPKAKPAHFDRYLDTEEYHTPFPVPESMFCEEEGFFDIFAKAYEYPGVPGEDVPLSTRVWKMSYKKNNGLVKMQGAGSYFYPYDLLI